MLLFNKYIFRVAGCANKKQIGRAIEEMYNVHVTSVNTVNIHRKERVRGTRKGWKSGYKKAIVTVKEGEKIELFEEK